MPDLLAQAVAGNEVIITEHGTPVARLVPVVAHSKKKRVAGLNRGITWTSEDFDDSLPNELWLGRNETSARHSTASSGGQINQNDFHTPLFPLWSVAK
jgi:antitoxin (DNA-binding transcriptional repressor) of toxin-antitoxin stability system